MSKRARNDQYMVRWSLKNVLFGRETHKAMKKGGGSEEKLRRFCFDFSFLVDTQHGHLELVGVLAESSFLGKAVNRVVRASLLTEETADGESGNVTSVDSLLINVGKVDLHGSVVLGSDQAVGSRAARKDDGGQEKGQKSRRSVFCTSRHVYALNAVLVPIATTYHLRGM